MSQRNLYLNNLPVEQALDRYLSALSPLLDPAHERVPSAEALDRVTARAVYAGQSSPLYNAAAMDGIAVIAARTAAARPNAPLRLEPGTDFLVVDTGDPVRPPFDAVVMAEDLQEREGGAVELIASAAPWQHIRPVGEDIVAGELILPGQHRIRPMDIGVLLAGGIPCVEVLRLPRVAILPTGDEIIPPGQAPAEGDIIESNGPMFAAMVREQGGLPTLSAVVPDDRARLRAAVTAAVAEADLVLINAGSSAGTEDYTAPVLAELGEVVVHGVAMKPGKPVILAIVAGKPVIGLPGYPVSAWLAFETFVSPLLRRLTGRVAEPEREVEAVMARRLVSSLKHREYVRVKLGRVGGKLVAAPLARGAGAAMSLVRADGFCIIPQNSEGVQAGEPVRVRLCRGLSEIESTAVAVGSHDMLLDVLADLMPARHPGQYLSSTHVGSLAGLLALGRGEAHLAPTHLLDEETGVYNIAWLKKLLPGLPLTLVKGVERIQGLIVPAGNPLGLRGVEDLPGKCYVNRQRGAGTRVLLDYRLKLAGIDPRSIEGYDREAATHMAVAAAVQSGSADVGMGVYSAAKALGLDFIPIGPEEYDFAIPTAFLELPQVAAFLDTLTCAEFQARLAALGGYGCPRTGERIPINV